MKNIFKTTIFACLVICIFASFLASCSDKLSELPTQSRVDGNVVTDATSAEALLNGMYSAYVATGKDNYDITSTLVSTYYGAYPADFAGVIEFYQGPYYLEIHGPSGYYISTFAGYFWTRYYTTLNAANAVIDQIGAVGDNILSSSKKNEMLGQAYAMRALGHYDLLRMFGYSWDIDSPYGDILRLQTSKTSNLTVPRSSVKETYDQILSDLDLAIKMAPADNEHWYISSWFAKGLKARVLMLRGQGSDYADAAELAKDIIENSPYALEENTDDLYHLNGVNSSDVIFGIKAYEGQTDTYETYFYYGEPQYLPTDNFFALFTDGDPRKQTLFHTAIGYNYIWTDTGYDIVPVEYNGIIKNLTNDEEPTASTVTESGYCMRLTEMYLLRAEALVRSNGSLEEAYSLVRTVMEKAGKTDLEELEAAKDDKDALMKQIFEEDLRSLFCECGIEHDIMLRFGEYATEFNPEYAEPMFNVLPIPTDEFKYNGDIKETDQNPGFSAE